MICTNTLPLIGFLLRSTNIRNAFELCAPLQRLCEEILEPEESPLTRKTRLVLSSEWYYQAQVHPAKEYLESYVLIGLPAPESSNPLLLPLAGHEMGHPLWHTQGLRDTYLQSAAANVITTVLQDLDTFKEAYPSEPPNTVINAHYLLQNVNRLFSTALDWLVDQTEETFCDFVGLRIFGYSYLKAFAYMVAPRLAMGRVEQYPKLTTRVCNLLIAANSFGVEAPSGYLDLFEDDEDPSYHNSAKYNLTLADNCLPMMVNKLQANVNELLPVSRIPLPSADEADRILGRLKKVVPAENSSSLANIINAAWLAFDDPHLWESIPRWPRSEIARSKRLF